MLKNKFIFIILLLCHFSFAQTSQWSVLWDQNTEPDIYQYWIYRGNSSNPTQLLTIVNHPNVSYVDNQLVKGVLYYYRVKAIDLSSNQSDFSENASAAIPKIDFSTLGTQYIQAGQTISITNLGNYVTDPDDNNLTWSSNTTSLTITFNNDRATITAPETFNSSVTAQFSATDADGFFDIAPVTFYPDTGGVVVEPENKVFAYPTLVNLAENPNAKVTFQNVSENATIYIYNMMGERIYKIENVPFEWDIKNEAGKKIYPGVYLYSVESNGKKRTGKLVIVK